MKKTLSNYIAFDVGSSKISGVAAYINKQGEAIINSQILHYSQGFKSGNITDMEAAENSIINAVYALEKDCDKSIKEVTISLSGAGVKSYYVNQSIKLGNNAISNTDVKKLINRALQDFKLKDREVIHYFPIEFKINNDRIVDNPVGIHAKELSCKLHIISADSLMIMNLVKCFAKCHVEVSEIIVAAYASGLAVLTPDEMHLGAIVLDIGAKTTSLGIWFNGKIIYVDHVPIGSADITYDIARTFSINLRDAEKIKILYGSASPSIMMKDSVIKIDGSEKTLTVSELIAVICPRVTEIFTKIKKRCDLIAVDDLPIRQVIITGGGAAPAGIKNLAADIFQKQIRIAQNEEFPGFAENYNSYSLSTLIGTVKSKSLSLQKNNFKSDSSNGSSRFKKILLWLKENI